MRLACFAGLLMLSSAPCLLDAADRAVADAVARISKVERRLPWFWSPSAEGLADVPYIYKVHMTRRFLTRGGQEMPAPGGFGTLLKWRNVQLERIPLDWGSFLRCLSEDGITPCSAAWNQELERETKQRDSHSPEERLRIDAVCEERRQRRRRFWDEFPAALKFESAGANQLRFSPRSGYKPPPGMLKSLLPAIAGQLSFDSATAEITQLEFTLLRDVDEPFLRMPKTARFEITLTQGADGHYLPHRTLVRHPAGHGGVVGERIDTFSDFQRFGSETNIQFVDPKEPEIQ